jgi:hypothetical protein
MKKKIIIGLAVLLVLVAAAAIFFIQGSKKSPFKSTSFSSNGLDIKVDYCQPSKRGRLIFGEEKDKALQPYGKYWRLGANAPTEITFSKNINFAGKPINAGTYRMYAVPGPTSFQIALNSEIGSFSGAGEPDHTKDILKADIPTIDNPETEQFVITFGSDSTGVKMDMAWDKILVRVPITLQ